MIKAKTGWEVSLTMSMNQDRYGHPIVNLVSEELVNRLGVKGLFSSLVIKNFGGGQVQKDGNIWFPVHWSWKHGNGGQNGAELAQVLVSPDGKLISDR